MKLVRFSIAAACLWAAVAQAQVPELGRWQDLDFGEVEVHTRTADRYWDMLIALSKDRRLDDDPVVLSRVKAVAPSLIHAAIRMKPEAAEWDWEIHTTSAEGIDALCMAGGKLLVGSAFVRRLDLDDGELATLVAHEIAHAVADHHREFLSSVLHVSPLPSASLDITMARLDSDLTLQVKLARLSSIQEREADQLGMILAHRAGWPAASMVGFYRKLAAAEAPSAMSGSHPLAASRLNMAKGMRMLFGE